MFKKMGKTDAIYREIETVVFSVNDVQVGCVFGEEGGRILHGPINHDHVHDFGKTERVFQEEVQIESTRFAFEVCVYDPDFHDVRFFTKKQMIMFSPNESSIFGLLLSFYRCVFSSQCTIRRLWGAAFRA